LPEFTARYYEGEGFAAESHTEPATVAAEQGAIGLLAYVALLAVTVGALLGATGLELRRRARGPALAATLLAVYALMLVHSLGYAAFLTDPITWTVLAIAVAALRRAPPAAGRA
jgi:O-antigen ligase